ncbi:protein kinase domain-containing protein [Kribbella solani]|uniref:non-specific serine/threonine protein kinase n=1 Tax=Kribbella solani TaxID=236067 RepID=A0A841DP25_9ACTN|nr:serine/threonine protein kinase [Kribbella solani]
MRGLGRYRLDHRIGSGAFATVWKGYDPEFDTAVAVKVLADNWIHHADVRERFLTEARLLRRIEDRRVVRVHDVGVDGDRPYFVMDYIHGGTLTDLLGKLDPSEALRIATEAAEAVHVLHEFGFMHRDIKPSNFLVDQTVSPVRVLVADLGTAKRLEDASCFTLTTGTPAYMAPEQAAGQGTYDTRADVYALAVVTWELLTGTRPDPTPTALTHTNPTSPHGPASRVRRPSPRLTRGRPLTRRPTPEIPGVTPQVIDLLTKSLSPNPNTRPPTANSFAQSLATASHPTTQTPHWPAPLVYAAALLTFTLTLFVTHLLL